MSEIERLLTFARLTEAGYAPDRRVAGYTRIDEVIAGNFYASAFAGEGQIVVSVRGTDGPLGLDSILDNFGIVGGIFGGEGTQGGIFTALSGFLGKYSDTGNLVVVGDSMGGAYAQWSALQFDYVKEVYAFDAPGIFGGLAGLFSGGHVKDPRVQLTYTEQWGLVGAPIHSLGDPLSNGNPLFIPGSSGHSIGSIIAALEYQVAFDRFFGGVSIGNWAPVPADLTNLYMFSATAPAVKGGFALLAREMGLRPEQLSTEYRMKLASGSYEGLSRSQAYAKQIETFVSLGYDRNEAQALTAYREALKFGSADALLAAMSKLADLELTPPDEESKLWAFCFSNDVLVSMADGTRKPIEAVAVGDEVLAFSSLHEKGAGSAVPRRVTRLFRHTTQEWLKLSNGVTVTPGHFFLTTDGTFEPISRILLERGGVVVLEDGSTERLTGELIRFSEDTAHLYETATVALYGSQGGAALKPDMVEGWATYNFEVEDLHTYIAGGMRVHNDCIANDAHLQVINSYEREINGVVNEFTQIVGHGGENYTINNTNSYVNHGMVFEKLPEGSKYAAKHYDPSTGVTFYYTEDKLNSMNYAQNAGGGGGGGEGGGRGDTKSDKPVLIDLDNDGVEYTPLFLSQTAFDYDADGYRERTAWVAKDDGLLVIDLGADGTLESVADGLINQAKEVVFTHWDSSALSDLDALKTFDTGAEGGDGAGDGFLDSRDAAFSKFKIWQDADQDGEADEGELRALSSLGIVSINLTSDLDFKLLADGSKSFGRVTFQKADGTTIIGEDMGLEHNVLGYKVVETATGYEVRFEKTDGSVSVDKIFEARTPDAVTIDLTAENYVSAIGNSGDDHFSVADARSATIDGKGGNDVIVGGSGSDSLMGGDGNDTIGGNDGDDAIAGGAGNDTLAGGAGNDLLDGGAGSDAINGGSGDDTIFVDGEDSLSQIDGGDGLDLINYSGSADLTLDITSLNAEAFSSGSGNDILSASGTSAVSIAGNDGNDKITGTDKNDLLSGGAGADILIGRGGKDGLIGGDGDDRLEAGDDDDSLQGGRGNDRLEGGAGDDIYYFNRGDGRDEIFDYDEDRRLETYEYTVEVAYQYQEAVTRQHQQQVAYQYTATVAQTYKSGKSTRTRYVNELRTGYRTETVTTTTMETRNAVRIETRSGVREVVVENDAGIDTLVYGAGIEVSDLVMRKVGDDMVVELRGLTDKDVLTDDHLTILGWADPRNRIENFSFGDGITLDVSQIENAASGGIGDDTLNGSALGDFISAGSGNDTVNAGDGRDIVVAGNGNDTVDGGAGRDFLFGDAGHDALSGGADDDYLIAGAGNDTLIGGAGNDALFGGDGDDILDGGDGDDYILSGAGADQLRGGSGSDTYFFMRGDGKDTILDQALAEESYQEATGNYSWRASGKSGEWVQEFRTAKRNVQVEGGRDTLQFGETIRMDDVFFQTVGDTLVAGLRERDASGGVVQLANLSDSVTVLSWANVQNRIEAIKFGDGAVFDMVGVTYAASGQDGDDTLLGTASGDVLAGGDGNDVLAGYAGDDNIIGGKGGDSLDGGDGYDDLFGGEGEDILLAGAGDDYVLGGSGNDTIDGGTGKDALSGGRGDDLLKGGLGDDIYLFMRGDGHDTIDETAYGQVQEAYQYTQAVQQTVQSGKSTTTVWVNETRTGYRSVTRPTEGGNDTLQFGSQITVSDLIINLVGSDLVVQLKPLESALGGVTDDSITILNWTVPEFRVENLRFINKFALDLADIDTAQTGSAGTDVLTGIAAHGNWLGGGDGADVLNGADKADIIFGGAGDDAMSGGLGDDIYVFNRGDGQDTVSDEGSGVVGTDKTKPGGDKLLFGAGISVEDLVLTMSGADMIIAVRPQGTWNGELASLTDQLRITNWAQAGNRIEVLQFFDGVDVDISQISATKLGTTLADVLAGTSGVDWMDGLAGADSIHGGSSGDFIFGRDGSDSLFGQDGDDVLVGGTDDDTLVGGAGNDALMGGSGADTILGEAGNDAIMAGAGDDIITGGDGNDIIVGEGGSDTFHAGAGDDLYRFGLGDGQDTFIKSGTAALAGDTIFEFENDIEEGALWFQKDSNDLVLRILGHDDNIRYKDWYDPANAEAHVFAFKTSDKYLTADKVGALVSAMASFTPNDGSTAYGIKADDLPSAVQVAVASSWRQLTA